MFHPSLLQGRSKTRPHTQQRHIMFLCKNNISNNSITLRHGRKPPNQHGKFVARGGLSDWVSSCELEDRRDT
jgi:hypothetical protein